MNLGIKVSSTTFTNEAKSYMNTPQMLPEVRGGFKMLLTIGTDRFADRVNNNNNNIFPIQYK